jgi:hypothetical protein
MKNKQKIVFTEATQTFRTSPGNHWVASIKNDRLVFDSWDGYTRDLLRSNPFIYIVVLYKFIKLKLF